MMYNPFADVTFVVDLLERLVSDQHAAKVAHVVVAAVVEMSSSSVDDAAPVVYSKRIQSNAS